MVAVNREPRAGLSADEAGLPAGDSLELWERLPEDFCRDHELDRGRLIRRESGSPGHQGASIALAIGLLAAAKETAFGDAKSRPRVVQALDTRLWGAPRATVRRPDVLVHRCLEPEAKLCAKDVLLAVEIVSPTSLATDTGKDDPLAGFESKKTQYARAGIKNYWIVRLKPDDSAVASIEEWRLLEGLGKYTLMAVWSHGTSREAVQTDQPFPIDLAWDDLRF